MTRKFIKSKIRFHLNPFNGLSKKYIIDCAFDNDIQSKWEPAIGNIILGPTGNIFVISGKHHTHESLGGDKFFFGGGLCNRDGGFVMNETYCNVLNKDGLEYYYDFNGDGMSIKSRENSYYSKFEDFRWIPYPYQLKKIKNGKTTKKAIL
jgi:hypothetical protein